MYNQHSLRELLREFETPEKVATHLGVTVKAVHSQMRIFRIHQNHVQLRQAIGGMIGIGEVSSLTVYGAADTLGVSRRAARKAMDMDRTICENPENASEEERRIRAALSAAEYKPRIAAETLRLELTVLFERINEFGINLPARYCSVAERRRIVQLIRKERPGMPTSDIATLIKISVSSIKAALRDPLSDVKKFSDELQHTLKSPELFAGVKNYEKYATDSASYFVHNTNHEMREGCLKQSFVYMLLDPRITCNLSEEAVSMDKFDIWNRFLRSIFYVGKGKSSRPYNHMNDAAIVYSCMSVEEKEPPLNFNSATKQNRIIEIWANKHGVVCLHVFHNIMPEEAYTREAAIIEALSRHHLTNEKRGTFYGPANGWTPKEKKYLGIALLYKAMEIYLAEGESQLSPSDCCRLYLPDEQAGGQP